MDKKPEQILIVDDHHLIVESYTALLEFYFPECKVVAVNTCEDAYKIIVTGKTFNLVIVDISLPPYVEQKLLSGEDLAIKIKRLLPTCKLLVITSHAEALILYNLVKRVHPDGLLVKSEVNSTQLHSTILSIFKDRICYSESVNNALKKLNSAEQYLDNVNRQIILLLARGIRSKNLPHHLPLSMSAIDKRKAFLRDFFNIPKGNDEDIVAAAKSHKLL